MAMPIGGRSFGGGHRRGKLNFNTSLFACPHSHLIFPKFASKGKLGVGSVGSNESDRGHLYDFSRFFSNGQPCRTTYQDTVQVTEREEFPEFPTRAAQLRARQGKRGEQGNSGTVIDKFEGRDIFYTCDLNHVHPWLNWIEHRSSEPRVGGSNPPGCIFRSYENRSQIRLRFFSCDGGFLKYPPQVPQFPANSKLREMLF